MMKKEKPMMSVTAIIQGAQTQHWGRTLAGFGGPHTPLGYPCTNGLTLNQNLSMGPMGPQSPIEMKPDASTLGQFSPQGPNSPGSFTLGSTNLLGGQKGATSPYPPNHPLSGSKHLCSICGDRASGKHYGVYSCEGCKGFFKRTVRKDLSYACREEKNCIIDKRQRNRCQYCRYQKCLSMGMKREAVQEERQRTKDRETSEVESTSNMQCEISIEKLIEAEKRVECTEPLVSLEGDLMTIGQATNKQVLQLVEWSKLIPHFTSLPLTDQVLLLKNGWNDLLIATIAHRSIGSDQGIVLSTGLTVTSTTAHAAGLGTIYDRILNEIVAKLKEKRVDKVELICLKAITLLNCNIRGLKSRKEVEMLRIRVYEVFEEYTKATYPNESGRFDKLMLRLPPLRSVSLKCVEPLFLFGLVGDVSIETFLTDMLQNPADI